jgi:hypothetical protein
MKSERQETGFWPSDLSLLQERTPVSILKEQAEILGKNTGYKLKGQVSTHTSEDGEILNVFYVVVPALDGYRYELFEISHGALGYPVKIVSSPKAEIEPDEDARDLYNRMKKTLATEDDFVAWLKTILGSKETRRLLASLLAQASA